MELSVNNEIYSSLLTYPNTLLCILNGSLLPYVLSMLFFRLFLETFCLSFICMLRYTPAARLSEVVYDSTLVTFTYDDSSGTVKTIHLTHNGFSSSIRYRQTGASKNPLMNKHHVNC